MNTNGTSLKQLLWNCSTEVSQTTQSSYKKHLNEKSFQDKNGKLLLFQRQPSVKQQLLLMYTCLLLLMFFTKSLIFHQCNLQKLLQKGGIIIYQQRPSRTFQIYFCEPYFGVVHRWALGCTLATFLYALPAFSCSHRTDLHNARTAVQQTFVVSSSQQVPVISVSTP